MADITIQDLLEAGVHFGHQTRRWNPKMKKYIFTERNGVYIIDLQKSLACLKKACDKIRDIAATGQPILYVGTKPQAANIVKEQAERAGQYYMTSRWPGGLMTNFRTIRQSIKRLDHLEKMSTDGTFEHLTKKEVLNLENQRVRLLDILEGIRNMNRLPGLVIVVDTKKEKIAVAESNRLRVPVCAIVDTNCDPEPITLPIPGNDDAIRAIKLILSAITDAIIEGKQLYTDKGIAEKEEAIAEDEQFDKDKKRGVHHPVSVKPPIDIDEVIIPDTEESDSEPVVVTGEDDSNKDSSMKQVKKFRRKPQRTKKSDDEAEVEE